MYTEATSIPTSTSTSRLTNVDRKLSESLFFSPVPSPHNESDTSNASNDLDTPSPVRSHTAVTISSYAWTVPKVVWPQKEQQPALLDEENDSKRLSSSPSHTLPCVPVALHFFHPRRRCTATPTTVNPTPTPNLLPFSSTFTKELTLTRRVFSESPPKPTGPLGASFDEGKGQVWVVVKEVWDDNVKAFSSVFGSRGGGEEGCDEGERSGDSDSNASINPHTHAPYVPAKRPQLNPFTYTQLSGCLRMSPGPVAIKPSPRMKN
ncbi:hypothetical protein D9758_017221 [Tetrapyrgos nigripes]|uniref:Uncharacterized protein n=1 Tax=Tetrapyrgos nigripes TaxID=182062 RepID=A0A8H5C0T9_9AGAR|nr:hypothetical protein D9758_017221 [Tetrapyrgos nigripes]